MNKNDCRDEIEQGYTVLGIELGSTRIKTVLINREYTPIASGSYEWENRLENGYWTYSQEEIWFGLQSSYRKMAEEVEKRYSVTLNRVGAIGFSAMMHGYLVFDKNEKLLVPFRTWRNSTTGKAAEELTELFQYNIPQRWSIAHLYQAILNKEEHVRKIAYMTSLSGYVHWKLTGERVIGIGDASGIFPIDINTKNYDGSMIRTFNTLLMEKGIEWSLENVMPKILLAGEEGGRLTKEGALLLDPTGNLQAGIPLSPPEGDAQTGMVATNSIEKRTGNVSVGTSIFASIILEKELSKVYPEIDLVTTPEGYLAANVHVNNGTSDLNAWVSLFGEFAECIGSPCNKEMLFETLYRKALKGDKECGGLLAYGYYSGENIMDVPEGRPLFVRRPESRFTLSNFMRTHLFAALAALKAGMDLLQEEDVQIDSLTAHGGLLKTEGVGQKFLAAALNAPVTVMQMAGEGGAWGMALLTAYMAEGRGEPLGTYLERILLNNNRKVLIPDPEDVKGFEIFMDRYKKGIGIEKEAVCSL